VEGSGLLGCWEKREEKTRLEENNNIIIWSRKSTVPESFRKILKNSKYYSKMFGEIGFEKYNVVFKIKILESSGDTGRYRHRWNFHKFIKFSEKGI